MTAFDFDNTIARAMIESANDGFLVVDPQGTIVFANRAACSMFGWAHDALIGEPIESLVPVPLRATHGVDRQRFTDDPRPRAMGQHRELAGLRRDGTTFAAEIGLNPLETRQGRFVFAAVRDVSERRRISDALTASERRLREFVDHAPDGIFVADSDGRYTDVNAAACALLGRRREDIVGRTIAEFVAPEELPRLAAAREQPAQPGVDIATSEWTFLHEDGTRVPTEIRGGMLADGHWQAFVRDIRARKRAEEALHAAVEERDAAMRELETTLEQCPIGLVIVRGGRVERNRAARDVWGTAFDPDRGVDQPTGCLRTPEGAPLTSADYPAARALRGERLEHVRIGVRTDGVQPLRLFEVNAAPIVDDRGHIAGATVAAWDVGAVVELERLRAEWNAVVAHDLRQPINSIALYTQIIERNAEKSPERVQRGVGEIRQLVARLSRMINDLLDLSRLDASRLALEVRAFDVVECVRAAVERTEIEHRDTRVEVEVVGDIPLLAGDPQRIAQVLDNLLSNAVKYGHAGSSVRIHVEHAGDRVAVAVTNDGPGIDPADLPRLFRRFERAGGMAGVPGIGLGLQITRGLVEAHGGTIAAESQPGAQTTFRFTLPVPAPPR